MPLTLPQGRRFVPAGSGPTTLRAYESDTMPTDAANDGGAYSMGLEFYVTAPATLTEIRFWQPSANEPSSDTRSGALWQVTDATTGTNLSGTSLFPATTPGWNVLTVSQSLTASVRYRAVVLHPNGRYPATASYYTSGAGATDLTLGGLLVIPSGANATGGDQQSFVTGAAMAYPTDSTGAHYGIDVAVVAA